MSDSESSLDLPARVDARGNIEPTGIRNNGDNDKLEEFKKLLKSMIDSQATSLDEDDALDDMPSNVTNNKNHDGNFKKY